MKDDPLCLYHVLIHHYMGVDLKRVWNVIASNLTTLHDAVEEMLAS